jgi:Uncharacterized protein conserved in bacteria (DUF2125)
MSRIPFRRAASRALILAGLGAAPAFAADKPASPEQAKALEAFFSGIVPKPAPGEPPSITVKADGAAYVVSFDLRALNGLFKGAAGKWAYDPAFLVYKAFEQDDGKWRVEMASFPKVVARSGEMTSSLEIPNPSQTLLVDPAIAWWIDGSAAAKGGVATSHGPGVDQTITFGPIKGEYKSTVGANGVVSSTTTDSLSDVAIKMSASDKEHPPVNIDGRFGSVGFDFGFDGLKTRKVFDLVTLVSAHRDDLGPQTDAIKALLRDLTTPGLKLAEGAEISKGLFSSPYGGIALGGAKVALAAANAGKDSSVSLAVNADGLSLPVGLAPPGSADLTPSRIDISASLKGIDMTAAASAAIDRLRLAGGPVLNDEDMAEVAGALLSAGPLRVEIAPSHVVAPAIDADLQGAVTYDMGKTSGAMTIRMRNFDKTMAAMKALTPDIQHKALPALAMAKGLAKSESDGALSWVVQVGADRSITVNGIPLGRAPD